MRSIAVLPALIAVAAAQAESFSIRASATAPSGPVDTGSACAQVAKLVKDSGLINPSINAEVSLRTFLYRRVEEMEVLVDKVRCNGVVH
jgi:hypothetical protein